MTNSGAKRSNAAAVEPDVPAIRTHARAAADRTQRVLICDAACTVIAEEGLEAASLRRIARELGCTTGLVMHYFASKDDLMIASLDRATDQLAALVAGPSGYEPETLDELIVMFCATLPIDEQRRRYWLVLSAFRSAAHTTPRLADHMRDYDAAVSVSARTIDAFATSTQRSRDDDLVVDLTAGFEALLDGLALCALEAPERYDARRVERIIRTTVDSWLAAARRAR